MNFPGNFGFDQNGDPIAPLLSAFLSALAQRRVGELGYRAQALLSCVASSDPIGAHGLKVALEDLIKELTPWIRGDTAGSVAGGKAESPVDMIDPSAPGGVNYELDAATGPELAAILDDLRHVAQYRARGAEPPTRMLFDGPPGCIAEGTRISYRRGKRNSSRSLPIEVFYDKFNGSCGGKGRSRAHAGVAWDSDLSTNLQSWNSTTGQLVYNEVSAVVDSGLKECIRIVTDSAGHVELTADHPVLMADGEFLWAGDVQPGDRLLVRGEMKPAFKETKRRVYSERVIVEGLKFHPNAWLKFVIDRTTGKRYVYGRTARARLVVEADMNDLSYDEFVRILKKDPETAETLVFLPREQDVHHKDENSMNDVRSNLVVMTHDGHAREHGDERNFDVQHTAIANVLLTTPIGTRRTYDITMTDPLNNFALNDGIIVHNCGKTQAAVWLAGGLKKKLAVIMLSKLISKWIGETGARFLAAAEEAREAGAVLLIDELDAVGSHRSDQDGSAVHATQVVGAMNQILENPKNRDLIIVGATNLPDMIDPAVSRRLQTRVMFGFPDASTRHRIASHHWKLAPLDDDTMETLLQRTEGKSGDALVRACHAANRAAARRGAAKAKETIVSVVSVGDALETASFVKSERIRAADVIAAIAGLSREVPLNREPSGIILPGREPNNRKQREHG